MAWFDQIEEFRRSATADSSNTTEALRRRLAQVHLLMDATPDGILQFYDSFDEGELEAKSKVRLGSIAGGDFGIGKNGLAKDKLFDLAILLRALDEKLAEGEEGPVSRPSEAWACPDLGVYVVPLAHFLDGRRGPRTGQAFARRGLLRHRVIPMEVRDIRIKLERHPDVLPSGAGAPSQLSSFGAGLFHGFEADLAYPSDDEFIVTAVSCKGGVQSAVRAHLEQAKADGCELVVWPELTIDPAAQDHITGLLQENSLDEGLLNIVVAGSWHRRHGEQTYNESTVLSGRGELLMVVRKMRRFQVGGKFEAITPGEAITLLVLENELLAFAICKDFCDKARQVPLKSLDIDIAVVPSMGCETTVLAHIDAADDLRVLFGTASFVVQQAYPAIDAIIGHIMKMPDKPNRLKAVDLAVATTWETFQREPLKH